MDKQAQKGETSRTAERGVFSWLQPRALPPDARGACVVIDLWRQTCLSDACNGGTPGMVTGGEGAVWDTFEGDGASCLAEEAHDLRWESCPGRGGSGWPLRE